MTPSEQVASSEVDGNERSQLAALSIVILARTLERTGGAEQQLAKLAVGLQKRGHRVHILTFYPPDDGQIDLSSYDIPVMSLDKAGRWDGIGFMRRLCHALREIRPDIVQAFLIPPNILAAAATLLTGRRFKLVWGVRASNMDLQKYDWTHRIAGCVEAVLSFIPDLVIANSEAGRTFALSRGFPAVRTKVVPNGIDIGRFAPNRTGSAELRRAWLDGGVGPLIGTVARVDPMKDYPTFLRAARRFAERVPTARFIAVGSIDTPYWSAIRRMTNEFGLGDQVLWLPAQDGIEQVMNALDVFTLTSAFGEGFPNVIGEAMSCGVPVVCTDVGDAGSLIGACGLVVPVGDDEKLAEAWYNVFCMEPAQRASMGQAARVRIKENFSRNQMVMRTEAAYRQMLG